MTQARPILQLDAVRYRWPGRSGFDLQIPLLGVTPGQTLLLRGESGSGKSTLLSLLGGTVLPQSGTVRILDTDMASLGAAARDRFRAESIGVIFQQFNLLPFASVMDNILLPLRFAPARRDRVAHPQGEARRLCSALGLPENLLRQGAGTLSVGQQQRVAVARALIGQPPLILADEPTSALDAANQGAFLDLLFAQCAARDATLIMVSHDARLADRFDQTLEMADIATTGRQAA
ncbi:ABC transporter ATP-binding protein [uncultured Roseobacter sp.]|uniref:ABC transporter ATP-binding protein n=1 Tax=uncultured Roseobacter sp. TaxID=114847 RepID=UPI00262A9BDD|nr:ABC transporter ATP-binding protein [uncultured Roseobacter sp.]